MVNEIIMSEIMELSDPKLHKVAMRVVNTFRVAGEKAVAHSADPAKYSIALDPNSLEQLFLSRFKELPTQTQQSARNKVMAFVNDPQKRAQAYGDLAGVNLKVATPVAAQVKALPFPAELMFHLSHLENLLNNPNGGILSGGGLIPQQTLNKLELRIHKVKCVDETDAIGFFTHEAGEDDIRLGGTSVDESGDTKKIPAFQVRDDFEDGVVKNYEPPRQFIWFKLTEGNSWPKKFFVTLVLAEKDWGGLADFIENLFKKIKEEVKTALTAAIISAGGAAIGGAIGAAIGAVVGFILGELIKWIKEWLGDDVFKPVSVAVNIGSLNSRFPGNKTDSREYIAKFKGHGGEYEVIYDWRLFA